MNEIKKLYANAGFIKTKGNCDVCPLDVGTCMRGYSECPYIYPPFTAEKQIELIKFLLDKYCDIRIRKNLEGAYYIKSFNDISCFSEDFEETLASFTNTHWQDLTEEDKTSIKNILER